MAINFPDSPSVNDTFVSAGFSYIWDGTVWTASGNPASSGASVSTGDTAPTNPSDGDLWYRSSDGRTYLYYNDGNSSQWVDSNPAVPSISDTFERSGTDVTLVNSGDNVGIGATPAVKLDVAGEIRSSTGILFGTDTAAVNTLDDFEEGTWTPILTAITPGTGSFVANGSNGGFYTKIGKRVFFQFNLSGTWTLGTASGNALIAGLPFTNAAAADRPGNSSYSPLVIPWNDGIDLPSGYILTGGLVAPNTSTLRMYAQTNTAVGAVEISDAAATLNIHGGGSYEVP